MSISIPIDSIPYETREIVAKDLCISLDKVTDRFKKKRFGFKPNTLDVYEIDEKDNLILPYSYAVTKKLHMPKPKSSHYLPISPEVIFTGALRDDQKSIKDEAIANLNEHGACLISAYPGFGKTCTSIYMTSKIKLKTLIILNRLVLMEQWQSAIIKFCPQAKVVCLKPTTKNSQQPCDYLIINAINIPKFGRDFFKDIGTVIVDEAHLILSKVLSQSLFYVHPKYLIGLSATPFRPDGMDALMTFFFTDKKIVRKMFKEHLVYKVDTKFTPEPDYDANGQLIWGSILEQQASNPARNQLIIDLITKHSDRIFLVLCKRVEQATTLHERLLSLGEKTSLFVGSTTAFDKDTRVLIGTTSKLGVGFDFDRLDALLLATDLEEYFIQYLGRVFRREDVKPLIFDLVDNHSVLKRHFSTRKAVYEETGGTIIKF